MSRAARAVSGWAILAALCGPAAVTEVRAAPAGVPASAPSGIGMGQVRGMVLFNDKPVPGVKVRLCAEAAWYTGCKGRTYESRTDAAGAYLFKQVKPGDYGIAANVFQTSRWIYTSERQFAKTHAVSGGQMLEVQDLHLFKDDLKSVSPAPGATVKEAFPTLAWRAYPDAASYRVQLFHLAPAPGSPSQTLAVLATQILPETPLANGTYGWTLTALNSRGAVLAQARQPSFKVAGVSNATTAVKLLAPGRESTLDARERVMLQWEAYPGATGYRLRLYAHSGKDEAPASQTVEVSGTRHSWPTPLARGSYSWGITALKGRSTLALSDASSFEVR